MITLMFDLIFTSINTIYMHFYQNAFIIIIILIMHTLNGEIINITTLSSPSQKVPQSMDVIKLYEL